jgi:hypothetical protein
MPDKKPLLLSLPAALKRVALSAASGLLFSGLVPLKADAQSGSETSAACAGVHDKLIALEASIEQFRAELTEKRNKVARDAETIGPEAFKPLLDIIDEQERQLQQQSEQIRASTCYVLKIGK